LYATTRNTFQISFPKSVTVQLVKKIDIDRNDGCSELLSRSVELDRYRVDDVQVNTQGSALAVADRVL
jgi:hypothetical protein